MHPAIWQQKDVINDKKAATDPVIVCTAAEDKTRQEFKEEADLNVLLRRYGAVPPPARAGGEWDFDQDLQQSLHAVREMRTGYANLDPELRRLYPTPLDLIAAVLRGEVQYKSEGTPEVPSGGPSDSPAAAPDKA